MQIFDVAKLEVGKKFPEPLFHSTGRKLLAPRTELTQKHIEALIRAGIDKVYMASTARPVLELGGSPVRTISVSELVVGTTPDTDLMTPDGVVIVQQNESIEEHHVTALKDSKIDFLLARPGANVDSIRTALEDMSRVVVSRIENLMKRSEYLRAPEARDPFIAGLKIPAKPELLNINAVQLLRRRLSSRLQPVFSMLETGKQPPLATLIDICEDLLDQMRSEPRQFCQLALMTSRREDYLPDHAISCAVLAMSIAAQMKMSLELIKEVIIGALVFDVGMLAIPKRIRIGATNLTEADRKQILQHPIYSLTMMEHLPGLTPIPRLMGFQHHERLNGEGYPNKPAPEAIADFSRVIAVADIFAAATNPRAYKSQKLPYSAMEELVHMAHRGQLDARVIKALLAAIGLFPVGSFVLLSNQVQAQVVGANPGRVDRPLVRAIGNNAVMGMVDLANAQFAHLKIVKAIPAPEGTPEAAAV